MRWRTPSTIWGRTASYTRFHAVEGRYTVCGKTVPPQHDLFPDSPELRSTQLGDVNCLPCILNSEYSKVFRS